MSVPNLKERLRQGPLHGCFVTFASPALAEFTAAMGFDFTLIDNEHGNMDPETLEDMVRASQCQQVPSIVRVSANREDAIRKALDFGAEGVQVPMVNTPEQALFASRASLFPPDGDRGVAFLPRAARYGLLTNKGEYLSQANKNRLLCVHIETPEAVSNLDSILDTQAADVYFIGPGDLAVSMGYGHDTQHPDVRNTINECMRKISAKGSIAGTYVSSGQQARMAIDNGARYLVTAISSHMSSGAADYFAACR